uniref:N-acetylmuramoyl-L-alanine amidase family protein n=1 Tax=Clostridium sp. NkU-1 TaxID=1095009 RepID=UPI00325FE853
MKFKKWEPFMALVLLVLVYVISSQAGKMAAGVNAKAGKEKPVVVIDAGHGGNDPGKIGIDGTLEKDINLQIANRLKKYLEASDVKVILTREDDNGLYSEKDSRKKDGGHEQAL